MAIIDKILRAGEGKILRKLEAIAKQVNALETAFVEMSDEELKALTPAYRERLANGETLDHLLPGGVRHGPRGRQAHARPAALRRADHGWGGPAPGQHRRDAHR